MGATLLWNLLEPNPSWSSRVLKCKYFPGPRLRCLDEEHVMKNGSSIYKICKKALPQFRDELYWIPGNEKSVSLWHDAILGQSPPQIPRMQNWMAAMGLNTIWDIFEWEIDEPNRWAGQVLPECQAELKIESNLLLSHLAGLALLDKSRKDKRGWGRQSGKYSTAEGYQRFSANYNVPDNPKIWNNLWSCSTLPKIEMFSQTLMHERVLIGENLEKMGFAGPFRCPLCAEASENISHLFLKCPYATSVLEGCAEALGRWKTITGQYLGMLSQLGQTL